MLKDYKKTIVTSDGSSIVLRPVERSDEEALRRLLGRIPEDEHWFLRQNLTDPHVLHQWLENIDYEQLLPMVAITEDGKEVVGILRLYRSASDCCVHIAYLRILVHPDYRAQHIGSWMIQECSELAKSLGVEKLIAEFVSGSEDVAIKAAQKLDFRLEAVLKEYVKDRNGMYRDLIIMVKNLFKEWDDF
jgi:RimJ/RimL family protein N-acetyltransferase